MYGLQALDFGTVQEPTGVHNDDIRTVVGAGNCVAVGTKLRQNTFSVDKGFWTAETNNTDLGCGFRHGALALILPAGGIVHSL